MCPLSACLVQALSHAGTPWEEPVAPIPPPAPAGAPHRQCPETCPGGWLSPAPPAPQGLSSPGGPGPCLRATVTPRVLCTSRGGTGWCEGLGSSVFRQHMWAWSWAPRERMFTHGCTCSSLTSGMELTLVMFLCSSGSVGPFGLRALCSAGHSLSLPTHLGCGCPAPLGASRKMLRRAVAPSALSLSSSSVYSPEIPI